MPTTKYFFIKHQKIPWAIKSWKHAKLRITSVKCLISHLVDQFPLDALILTPERSEGETTRRPSGIDSTKWKIRHFTLPINNYNHSWWRHRHLWWKLILGEWNSWCIPCQVVVILQYLPSILQVYQSLEPNPSGTAPCLIFTWFLLQVISMEQTVLHDKLSYQDNGTSSSVEGPFYSSIFGTDLVMPQWEALLTIASLTTVILATIIGNILVIVSVFTYTPLKITPNFFIVSLAAADLTVSIFVLPINVIYSVVGRWLFGSIVCKMWLTSDVLCCTASILNLCAIALDR